MIDKVKKMWPDWEVIDNLGGGTFGQVYEIHRKIFSHTDKAALKVLSIPKNKSDIQELFYNGYDQRSITERYKNHLEDIVKEYALMSELKGCANVVYCDDVRYIQHPDGIGWDIHIKMELLHPIISVLKIPVDEQQVIKIGTDICNALVLCKEKNIVHRDIKPQNLFVSDDGTFKLGDFGIAKTAERTMGGTKTGTYNYMAPEVYNNQPYGSAADQYSLGMVLYWLLNERRMPFFPLPPQIPTASQEEQARQRRMSGEIPPEPKHGSGALKAVVMKAIAPNPTDRFHSIAEMRTALKQVEKSDVLGSQDPVIKKNNDSMKSAMDADDPSIGGDAAFFSFSEERSMESDSLHFEDEVIPDADRSVGNSWSFDEDSVGPEAGFSNVFHDFKEEGTVGVKNESKKKPNSEEIKHKNSNNEVSKDQGMVLYKVLDNDWLEPVSLVKGATYLFYVDRGNTMECCFKEPKIVCGEGSQFTSLPINVGKHTVSVRIYGPDDPKCKGTPIYFHPPVSFEVKRGGSVTIQASRPTKMDDLKVDVIYKKYQEKAAEEKKETKTQSTQNTQNKKDVAGRKEGQVEYHVLNDNHSPLALANGAHYLFIQDGNKKGSSGCKEIKVTAERKEQIKKGTAVEGEFHTIEVRVYGTKDPDCTGLPIYECPPVRFEVKPGYTTVIKANRPSPLRKLKLTVSYK